MKKEAKFPLVLLGVFMIASVSAFSFAETVDEIGIDNILFATIFLVSMALVYAPLSKVFKDKYGYTQKGIAGTIAIAIAILISYGLNNFGVDSSTLGGFGLDSEILEILMPFIFLFASIFLIAKFKFRGFLLILGTLFTAIGTLTDWVYEEGILTAIGIVMMILGLLLVWRKHRKKKDPYYSNYGRKPGLFQKFRNMRDPSRRLQKLKNKHSLRQYKDQISDYKGQRVQKWMGDMGRGLGTIAGSLRGGHKKQKSQSDFLQKTQKDAIEEMKKRKKENQNQEVKLIGQDKMNEMIKRHRKDQEKIQKEMKEQEKVKQIEYKRQKEESEDQKKARALQLRWQKDSRRISKYNAQTPEDIQKLIKEVRGFLRFYHPDHYKLQYTKTVATQITQELTQYLRGLRENERQLLEMQKQTQKESAQQKERLLIEDKRNKSLQELYRQYETAKIKLSQADKNSQQAARNVQNAQVRFNEARSINKGVHSAQRAYDRSVQEAKKAADEWQKAVLRITEIENKIKNA